MKDSTLVVVPYPFYTVPIAFCTIIMLIKYAVSSDNFIRVLPYLFIQVITILVWVSVAVF